MRSMRTGSRTWILALTTLGLACLAGCSDDASATDAAVLDRLAAALGGKTEIAAVTNERTNASGKRWSSGEGFNPSKPAQIGDFSYTLTESADKAEYHLAMKGEAALFMFKLDYTEVGNEGSGYVDGVDFVFNPPPARAPSPSARIAARLRDSDLTSMLRLAKKLLAPGANVTLSEANVGGKAQNVLTLTEKDRQPIKLFVDSATGQPIKAETLEDHPPLGDTVVEVSYGDFKDVGKLKLPHKIELAFDGEKAHEETRSEVETNVAIDPDPFAVPADLKKDYDETAGAFGIRSAQWLLSFGYASLPFFYNPQIAPAAPMPVEIAKGVNVAVGATHNVLAIEMADHVIAVDAPLYPEYTKAVLAQISAAFPGKPLKRVIAAHFHHDHCGGIREFAAEGNVTVNAGTPSVDAFKEIFTRAHTISPDRLQASNVPVVVEPVDSLLTIAAPAGNEIQLHRISTDHSEDMLIVYLKNEKMVFEADLWAPTPTMPPTGSGGTFAKQLYQAITDLNLDVTTVVSAHSGTLDGKAYAFSAPIAYLRAAAGL